MIRYPDVAGVVAIHEIVMRRMGESGSGLLYAGGLPYCIETAMDVEEAIESQKALSRIAAYYIWCLITNHPFVDGNKRTPFQTSDVFLRANGFKFGDLDPYEAVSILKGVATGEVPFEELSVWVEKHLSSEVLSG